MKEIKHIFEPNLLACGQAVVAMLTGADVTEIMRLAGTERETTLADMRRLLSHFGLSLSSERVQAQDISELPDMAVLSLETPRCWHWSLYYGGKVYDPEHGVLDGFPISNRKYFWEVRQTEN